MHNLPTLKDNWRVYPLIVNNQQQHIEQSEHLLSNVQPDDPPTLYWSLAEPIGLVLGFSQKQETLNQEALAAYATLPIYHRRAGGTAVLVGPHLLSLDVILPAESPLVLPDIVESYRWFGTAWVAALSLLGIQTQLVTPGEARTQQALRKQPETRAYESLMYRACYGTLSPYEVVADRRKVVGLDMIRRRQGSLLQAGVLLHWDSAILAQLLGQTEEEQALLYTGLHERAIGIDALAGRVIEASEVLTAFEHVIMST